MKDLCGNRMYSVIDEVIVDIKLLKLGVVLKVNIRDLYDGCYEVIYRFEIIGEFNMFIIIVGEVIRGSFFCIKVDKGGIKGKLFFYELGNFFFRFFY